MSSLYLEGPKFFHAVQALLMRAEQESDYKRNVSFIYQMDQFKDERSLYVSVGKMNRKIKIILFIFTPSESIFGMIPMELYIQSGTIKIKIDSTNSFLMKEFKDLFLERKFWSSFKNRIPRDDYMSMVTLMKNIAPKIRSA